MAKKSNLFNRLIDFGRELFGRKKKADSRQAKKEREIQKPIQKPIQNPIQESIQESIQEPIQEPKFTSQQAEIIEEYSTPPPNEYSDYIRDDYDFDFDKFNKRKNEFQPIIDEANRRAGNLINMALASSALERVESETGRQFFTLDYAETIPELIAEATRARVFLADKTSTIEGAKVYTAQLNAIEFKGKFGNQYHTWEHNYKNFDTTVIDEEIAKEVFANYRKLEELRAADIIGEGAYGSENLIIAMYDAQIHGEDSYMIGLEQLDSFHRQKTEEWQERFERANSVASILGFYLNEDEEGWYF